MLTKMDENQKKTEDTSNDFTDISWESLSSGVSDSKTYRMIRPNDQMLRFSGSYSVFFTSIIMMGSGIASILSIFAGASKILLIFGVILLLFAIHHFMLHANPLIFDKQAGVYKKGWKPLLQRILLPKKNLSVKLHDIVAIQLLKELRSRDHSDDSYSSQYHTYEINLILANKKRLNVIDSGHRKSTLDYAKTLSNFLNIPLLNRVER